MSLWEPSVGTCPFSIKTIIIARKETNCRHFTLNKTTTRSISRLEPWIRAAHVQRLYIVVRSCMQKKRWQHRNLKICIQRTNHFGCSLYSKSNRRFSFLIPELFLMWWSQFQATERKHKLHVMCYSQFWPFVNKLLFGTRNRFTCRDIIWIRLYMWANRKWMPQILILQWTASSQRRINNHEKSQNWIHDTTQIVNM